MTDKERREQIDYHRAKLKELQAVPRSDWHAGFEALLRIETHKFGNKIHLLTEEVLGEEPPRADYVVLVEDEKVEFDKEIFRLFRKHNIIEYKNPNDALNERVIRKICGYANLYIGTAEHEGDIPSDEVTITIFRNVKNKKLFAEMEGASTLKCTDVSGVYLVRGLTDIPFQIIITSELQGDEYAAYRALTDKADERDVEYVINAIGKEADYRMREHYMVYLRLVVDKNPIIAEVLRRDEAMEDVLLDIVKDRIDEQVNAKEQEITVSYLKDIMESFGVTVDRAMESLKIPQGQRAVYKGLVNGN